MTEELAGNTARVYTRACAHTCAGHGPDRARGDDAVAQVVVQRDVQERDLASVFDQAAVAAHDGCPDVADHALCRVLDALVPRVVVPARIGRNMHPRRIVSLLRWRLLRGLGVDITHLGMRVQEYAIQY